MSEIGLLLRHFSDDASSAVSCAERPAQDADDREVNARHLLVSVIWRGQVGARALAAAGISPESVTQALRHYAPGKRPPSVLRRRLASHDRPNGVNKAYRRLNRPFSLNRLANFLFSRIRHPPEGEDFEHAVILAFRISQERPDGVADTGDLLLGVLDVFMKLPVGAELARIGFEPSVLIGKIEEERRQRPETRGW